MKSTWTYTLDVVISIDDAIENHAPYSARIHRGKGVAQEGSV